jgi:aspartate racemase
MSDGDGEIAPEVSLHSHPFGEYMRRISLGNWEGVAGLMLSSAHNLAQLGASFCVAPCNTIHLAFEYMRSRSPVPWLHIAEEVASEAQRQGFRRVALLGTKLLMESRVYTNEFARIGVETQIPLKNEQENIERFIFAEMVRGIFTPQARSCVMQVIERLRADGCDAVGMCCTELPMLVGETDTAIPLLDSTRILALAALNRVSARHALDSCGRTSLSRHD